MNKAKLIKELTKFKELYSTYTGEYQHGEYRAYNVALEFAKELDEPGKVIVPACAEPWLEKAQYSSDVISLFSEVEYATDSDGFIEEKWDWSGEFYDWLANDSDTIFILSDALRYGYEVENEPEWVVKVGKLYLLKPPGDTSDFTIKTTWNPDRAYRFSNQDSAKAHAAKFDGSVEPADEN